MTPEELSRMDPDARLARFEDLAKRRYGRGVAVGVAREFELHRSTVTNWRVNPAAMPIAVLIALEALEAGGFDARLRAAGEELIRADKALVRASAAVAAAAASVRGG